MAGFRTVVINKRCKLESCLGYLVVRSLEEERIHISEIENLILESTAISITSALIVDLIDQGVNVIFCDRYHLPSSSLLPLNLHLTRTKNIYKQIAWSYKVKQLCWSLIIKEKIRQQAYVLGVSHRDEDKESLLSLAESVDIGDIGNKEAQAAKLYFSSLFGDGFSRRDDEEEVNKALNYGYALIMSCVAREIVACGYATEIGIWHDRACNNFNFACDLVEPFRPLVDLHVYEMPESEENFKHYMIKLFERKILLDNEDLYLVYAIRTFIRKVIRILNEEDTSLYSLSYIRE